MNENEILNNLQNVQVERKSLPEQVSEQIRQLIIDQNLKVGSKIPNEFELCQQLNVGRGTVREAIKLLVSRNVLEIQRGKGTYVADNTGLVDDPFGLEYIEDKEKLVGDLFEIRMQLEVWIAGLAAQRRNAADLDKLKRAQKLVENALDRGEDFRKEDQAFHVAIAECTHNSVLPKIIPVITYGIHLFGVMRTDLPSMKGVTARTHAEIVRAIEQQDAAAAQEAMREHLLQNQKNIKGLCNR